MAYIPEPTRFTVFDETVTAERVSVLNYKPTWGASKINYDILESNGGAVTGSASGSGYDGTIKLSTGTNTTGQATIETKLLGQYQAGSQAEVGWGVIIPTLPSGSQMAEWSYSTQAQNSGFGWGVDSTEPYIFYTVNGSKNKIYQSNWNKNTLSGSFDLSDGLIFQTEFTWYGFGAIKFYVQDRASSDQTVRTLVHRVDISGSLTMIDPNQPIRFDVENNGATTNFDMYVAGHQFSILAGSDRTRKRSIAFDTGIIDLQNSSEWQPLVAVTRRTNFRGNENTVNAVVSGFKGVCSTDATFRIASADDGTITNPTYSEHPDWGDESAVLITTSSGATPLSSSGRVYPADYKYVTAGGNEEGVSLAENREILLGNGSEAIVYVKLDTAAANETSKVTIEWIEEW